LPKHKIDGLDIWPLLKGDAKAKNPHDAYFFYYNANELQAVRSGQWKLILPHTYRTLGQQAKAKDGIPVKYRNVQAGLELYDLGKDSGETRNVADQHPDVVKHLTALAEQAREDLGDKLTNRTGKGVREPGRIREPN
jgi:arylsulfatase